MEDLCGGFHRTSSPKKDVVRALLGCRSRDVWSITVMICFTRHLTVDNCKQLTRKMRALLGYQIMHCGKTDENRRTAVIEKNIHREEEYIEFIHMQLNM